MSNVTIWMAFFAGIASFLSPCCLPLYPTYLSYITGISVNQLKPDVSSSSARLRVLLHAACFSVGFSIVFFALGWSVGLLQDFFINYSDLLRRLAAIFIFVMGLVMLGIFRPQILMKEWKWTPSVKTVKSAGYLGSVIIGIGFAAGWSPCVGPILAAILALSLVDQGAWLPLISAYSLGFAIPFMALAFFLGSTGWIKRYSGLIMKIGGTIMVLAAFLLYTDRMTRITIWFNQYTPDWLKF